MKIVEPPILEQDRDCPGRPTRRFLMPGRLPGRVNAGQQAGERSNFLAAVIALTSILVPMVPAIDASAAPKPDSGVDGSGRQVCCVASVPSEEPVVPPSGDGASARSAVRQGRTVALTSSAAQWQWSDRLPSGHRPKQCGRAS